MTPKKTIYYDNLLEDEFSGTKIERKPLPENYKYYRKNPFYRAFAWFIYYLIAFPIIYLVVRFYGYRIKGAKKKAGNAGWRCWKSRKLLVKRRRRLGSRSAKMRRTAEMASNRKGLLAVGWSCLPIPPM